MTFLSGVRIMLLVVSLVGGLIAQQNSSQKWNPTPFPGSWVAAVAGTSYSGARVTTASEGEVDYWVVWGVEGGKVFRVRKDDPSLSDNEKERFQEAEEDDQGVEVQIGDGPTVTGVTVTP
jgi:hypothetical protein